MKLKKYGLPTLCLAASVLSFGASAIERNDIPSCYDYADVSEFKLGHAERELFVIVDKTINLDTNLKKSVHQQMQRFNQAGDKITIITFSALAKGAYTDVVFSGTFESALGKKSRDNMNRMKLHKLDQCLEQQKGAINAIHKALAASFPQEEINYPQTELVGTLMNLSDDLIKRSTSSRKIVLVVSDMLENSATISFYKKGSVYLPDANKALTIIDKAGFTGDFDGSEVYVIGAGYVEGAKRYSSQKSVNELENFWRAVFTTNNAKLVQFGKPSLLVAIQ
ncbi:hypothetical protein [Vibrio tapetis]|uniref:VWFA domain-containing protein n=1 Tax=Vibrio tapetis subsp. tapetis TaxID=1671868 RepID=A0A2N8Z8E0_9VIBR|nr:hypothetical protein [Vibrio tapetis]SON48146.1 conserved exported protein of unknown function [Vibrio tapetis subsp. tapetis]